MSATTPLAAKASLLLHRGHDRHPNRTSPSLSWPRTPLLRKSRRSLRFDGSPQSLARWASEDFAADPFDESNLRYGITWQSQASFMESAWAFLAMSMILGALWTCGRRLVRCWQQYRGGTGSLMELIKSGIVQTFSMDLRALALCRIWLILVILWDVVPQIWHIRLIRTDQSPFYRENDAHIYFCPHCWNSHVSWQLLMMLITVGVFLCLLFGCCGFISSVATWLMWKSMTEALKTSTQGGDDICTLLLFWGCFLPWTFRFSVDARPAANLAYGAGVFASPAVLGLMATILDIYISVVMRRTGPDWNSDYAAVWNVFHDPLLTKPLGHVLVRYPCLCRCLTFSAMKLEFWCPLFLLSGSLFNGVIRGAACVAMIGLHMGLGLTVALGWFQCVAAALWLAFLPPCVCDWLEFNALKLGSAIGSQIPILRWLRSARSMDAGDMSFRADIELEAVATDGASHEQVAGAARRRQPKPNLSGFPSVSVAADNFDDFVGEKRLAASFHVPAISLGLRDWVAFLMFAVLFAARLGPDRNRAQVLYEAFGLKVSWELFSSTQIVAAGKDVIVGTLADGMQLRLNALGLDARRDTLLAAAPRDNNTEAWFDVSDTSDEPMEEMFFPRQVRSLAKVFVDHRDARLMYQQQWCINWNGKSNSNGAGLPSDPQRLISVDIYYGLKIGYVIASRGFIGIEGFRCHRKTAFQCGRTWQDYLREEGWSDEEMRQHNTPKKEKMSEVVANAGFMRKLEKMMLAHLHEGGHGKGKFRVDYTIP